MIRLQLFGYPTLLREGAALNGPVAQRHRLALLALLGLASRRTLARDKILGLLWPESDTADARHLLNTCVHTIRRTCGEDILITTYDEVSLSPDAPLDVSDFDAAVTCGDHERAVACYRAPFLDGFYLEGANEFEQWTSRERDRLSARHCGAIESLAADSERTGDLPGAIRWWRRLTHLDPFNSRAVMRLMLLLERTGDSGNALELALDHESLLARELDARPSEEFRELVRRMRTAPDDVEESALSLPADPATRGEPASPSEPTKALRLPTTWKLAHRATIAALAAVVGAVAWRTFALNRVEDQSDRILVLPFENATGDSTLFPLSRIVATWITDGLARTGAFEVITSARIAAPTAPQNPLAEARTARAALVLTGSVLLKGVDSIRLEAMVIDASSGAVLSSLPSVVGMRGDPMQAVEQVRSRLAGVLAALIDERIGRAAATISPPMYAAYVEYIAGIEQVQAGHVAQFRFMEAARIDTTFTLALIWAAYTLDRCEGARARGFTSPCLPASWDSLIGVADSRRGQLSPLERHALHFAKAWRTRDHRLYYESANAAARLVPVSFWTAHAFMSALDVGRSDEALRIMDSMRNVPLFERVFPAFRNWYVPELHLAGRFHDALSEATSQERSPGPLDSPAAILLARAENMAALGMVDSTFRMAELVATRRNAAMGVARLAHELYVHGYDAAGDSLARYCGQLARDDADTARTTMLAAAECAAVQRKFGKAKRLYEACCIEGRFPQATLLSRIGSYAALGGDTVAALKYMDAIDTLSPNKASNTRGFANEFKAEKLDAQAMIAAALGDGPRAVNMLQEAFRTWGRRREVFWHRQAANPAYDRIRSYAPYARLLESVR